MLNIPLGKLCANRRGLKLSGAQQLVMWAKLIAIKLITESVLVTSKEVGVETRAWKTGHMFMCLMIMLCSTLYTELLLYGLYTCSAISVETVERDQRLLCPVRRYSPVTCLGFGFCKTSHQCVWPFAASARRRFEKLPQQKLRRSWPVDFAVFCLLQITAHPWQGFHRTSFSDVLLSPNATPVQVRTGPEGSRRMRLQNCKTVGTWRW